jgi:uncharacterized protein (DUF305 family)
MVFAAGLAIGLAGRATSEARDAKTTLSVDCSKADSMMTEVHPSMQAMTPSGDIDKDFAKTMMMHNAAMMTMLKTEMACGKDAKTKAMARKMLEQATIDAGDLHVLLGGGG